jgi:hypothetical protein
MNMETLKQIVPRHLRALLLLVLVGTVAASGGLLRAENSHADQVKAALKLMREEAAKLGEPKIDGSRLSFGATKINGDYTIVDGLKAQFSCTATFFSKKGTDYVRVSTNVLNDGNRAVGTVLNPQGPAYAAIAKGEPYYGLVDILGKKYEAGYEPIKNSSGETVGVYYVGFLLE